MDLQVRALFTHDDHSRLLQVNEPGHAVAAPRFFLGRTSAGNLWRFRADIPDHVVEELNALCETEPAGFEPGIAPRHVDAYVALLETHAAVSKFWSGPVYRFLALQAPSRSLVLVDENNSDLLQGGFEGLADETIAAQPFVALLENGRAVSVCRSVRVTPEVHEAGVETLPEFRGNGYAVEVVVAWARMVQDAGAAPLYSTSWENTASQAVANKLNLELFGADFHVT
ncbi:MAG: GNAT family N-acetyltransferase [Pyrinomonadaceae bacterium]